MVCPPLDGVLICGLSCGDVVGGGTGVGGGVGVNGGFPSLGGVMGGYLRFGWVYIGVCTFWVCGRIFTSNGV